MTYHQARFEKTRHQLYQAHDTLVLSEYLQPPSVGTYRVRIEYDTTIQKIEYLPYIPREIQHFACVESSFSYAYKSCNREELHAAIVPNVDDVIFTCKGLLQDTSIANIALCIDGHWYTPKKPLLEGTTRARLLENGMLKAESLDMKSLQKAQKFAIMNALIGFRIIENVLIKE